MDAGGASRARIEVCGGLSIDVDGRAVEQDLEGPRIRALFVYLLRHRARPVARSELLTELWDGARPAFPENALSTALTRLRRAIAPIRVTGRQQLTLDLGPNPLVDVEVAVARADKAERALAGGDFRAAIMEAAGAWQIIARPLTPGLDAPWLDVWRDELAAVEANVLETMARGGLALGGAALPSAERAARRLVEHHPYRESAYALLMRIVAAPGNAAEASLTFHKLRELLAEEMGTAPSPWIVELHEQLLREGGQSGDKKGRRATDRLPEPRPEPPEPPKPRPEPPGGVGAPEPAGAFVEREREMAQLRAAWREAVGGARRLVAIRGEPGVGKTRLAAEFARGVREDGGGVLYGRSEEDAVLPYQPFVEAIRAFLPDAVDTRDPALEPAAAALGWLVPQLRRPGKEGAPDVLGDSQEERVRTFEAFTGLFEWIAGSGPLLLVLDDVHSIDKGTLLLLRHLLRHLRTRLMVVVTARDTEAEGQPVRALLGDLRNDYRPVRMHLRCLSPDATGVLARDALGAAATPELVRALHERTGGNPLFVNETLRAIGEADGVARRDAIGADVLQGIGVPEGVIDVIGRRVDGLPPDVARTLSTASVIGRHFDLAVLARVLDVDPDETLGTIEHAIRANLVYEDADRAERFAFCHALMRETLYDALTVSRRSRLAKRVAVVADELRTPAA